MDDLPAFLRARLDDDDAAANALWQREGPVYNWFGEPLAKRVLREVEAKRALLGDENEGIVMYLITERAIWPPEVDHFADMTLRYLAAVYRDHPDYRPEWKP